MLFWILITSAGFADPPDRNVMHWELGDTDLDRATLSADKSLLAGSDGGTALWALSTEDWSRHTWSGGCAVSGAAIVDGVFPNKTIWMACGDGTVSALTFDGTNLTEVNATDGGVLSVAVDSERLDGIWYDSNGELLYLIAEGSDGLGARVHVMDPATQAVDAFALSTWVDGGVSLYDSGFVDGLVHNGYLFIAHGGSELSSLVLGSTGVSSNTGTFAVSVDDVTPSPNGAVYGLDTNGTVVDYLLGSSTFATVLTGLDESEAACTHLTDSGEDDWLLVVGETVYSYGISGGFLESEPVSSFAPRFDGSVSDCLAFDGYAVSVGRAGLIYIYTARPWVYVEETYASTQETLTEGDTFSVSTRADQSVDFELRRGGDRSCDGSLMGSASASAEESISFDLSVESDWVEGVNFLYACATNTSTGLDGHAVASVVVDNPPQPPTLRDSNLAFADGALVLSFEGIADADLDYYEVFVAQTPFESSSWDDASGGPEFDGSTTLKSPIRQQSAGGDNVTLRIEPLENNVTYYVAVRATDTGGKEGPMSNVIEGMPRPAYTAAELVNERGGSPMCSQTGAAGWLALLAGGLAFTRRRSAVAGLLLCGLALPSVAGAADGRNGPAKDMTPTRANFEMRYGVINFHEKKGKSNAIDDVYNQNPHNILMFEVGPQFFRAFEMDMGFGFYQELSFTVDDSGGQSGDRTMLTWYPFNLGGTVRAQFLDEQFIVPFARGGFDYVIWNEKSDDGAGGKDSLGGVKVGNHYGFGLNFLLDIFSPNRASLLEAQTGINDTFLTFDWRRQFVDHRQYPWKTKRKQGLDFSSDVFTVGLKLDY